MSILLGVDPGSHNLGYGVIEASGARLVHRDHGTLKAPAKAMLAARLASLYAGLLEVIDRHQPDVLAVEQVFTARNPAAALTLGQARGIVLLLAGQRQLPLAEYAPSQIKQAVGVGGRAPKAQVARMTERILRVPLAQTASDATDALAVAICHAAAARRSIALARAGRGGA